MTNYTSYDPLNNLTNLYQRPIFISADRAPRDIRTYPTSADIQPPGTQWQNSSVSPATIYETNGGGYWYIADTDNVSQFTGNTGTAVPDSNQNINILGTSGEIDVVASGSTLTLSLTGSGTAIDTIQVDSGGPVTPDTNGLVSLIGGTNITVTASAAPTTQAVVNVTGQIPVANGGTGTATYTAYSTIVAGTTPTGNFQDSGAPGASGTVWTSNGPSALPTWQSNTAFAKVTMQVIPSNGTYTAPAGLSYAIVEVLGGGGGGGGAESTTSNTNASAGGGGAGGYARSVLPAATIGASQTVTIGTGGSGGAAGWNSGNSGGTSSFGSLVIATGGSGGAGGGAAGFSSGAGGAGGVGTSGAFLVNGDPGYQGAGFRNSEVICWAVSGHGGSSCFGGGGLAVGAAGFSSAGNAATNYGSGGGGAANASGSGVTQPAVAGGNGSSGVVIVTEFY